MKKNFSISKKVKLEKFMRTGTSALRQNPDNFKNIKIFLLTLFIISLLTTLASAEEAFWNGTGIIMGVKNNELTVIGVFPNSPAGKAGVKPGDKIVEYEIVRGFEKAHPYNGYRLSRSLNSNPGRKIGLRLERRGKNIEVHLKTIKIPISGSNLPRSLVGKGKITDIKNRSGKTTFTSRDNVKWGDKFLAFNGRNYLGQVSITEVHSDYSKIKFIGNFRKINPEKFNGAQLYLVQNSPRHYNQFKKPPSWKSHPTYKKYWQGVVRDEYKILNTAIITKINKTTGKISTISHRASSAGPGAIRVFDVKFDFYYSKNKTEFLPKGCSRKFKVGDTLDIFYKEEHGRKIAYLIVLVVEKK